MTLRLTPLDNGPTPAIRPAARGPAAPARPASSAAGDGVTVHPPVDRLTRLHQEAPAGVRLATSPAEERAIAAGRHQIRTVDGRVLTYPSQDLRQIESRSPDRPGQTHAIARHVGTTLAQNVARLSASPDLRAAGSYASLADAQFATDETIANPANQRAIDAFLADPGRCKTVLARVDLGRAVGTTTLQRDVVAGKPTLVTGRTATVVLIKDPSFPEGYRVLTTYPDTGRPEVDVRGNEIP